MFPNSTVVTKTNISFKFLLMVAIFLLSFSTVNAQSLSKEQLVELLPSNSVSNAVAVDSQIDFVGWFMGSNQNQSIFEGENSFDKTVSTKKQIISSGIVPNRVLYKTLAKKIFVSVVV